MGREKRHVIIGAVAAGGSAAFKLKRLDPSLQVQVLEAGEHISYAACGLPYYISGVIPNYHSMVMRTREDFEKGAGIELYTSHRAREVDLERGEVRAEDLLSGSVISFPFDRLLLATGASPLVPPIEGIELEGVVTLRTLQQGLQIKEQLQMKDIQRVLIIGGGLIGLELAETFRVLGKDVLVLEKMPVLLPGVDAELSSLLEEELYKNGVSVQKEESLEAFQGDKEGRLQEVVSSKGTYSAELAVMALGIRPNSELAREAGLKLGEGGAVAVDRYLRTSVPHVFAAGDCAEAYHRVLERNTYLPLGTTANRQGRLAAENMHGQNMKLFSGVLGSAVAKVFDLSVARTGLSEEQAQEAGVSCDSVWVKTLDQAPYYPGSAHLNIKLTFHPSSGKLLGGQLVGREKAVKRVDVIAAALSAGMTVEELAELDTAYAPPFSEVWEGLVVAAGAAVGKREKYA